MKGNNKLINHATIILFVYLDEKGDASCYNGDCMRCFKNGSNRRKCVKEIRYKVERRQRHTRGILRKNKKN